jgi:hypothetical protein
MTQGFKPLKKAPAKAKPQVKPKVGKRIAPKKKAAVDEVRQHRVRTHGLQRLTQRNTAASTSRIEHEMAGRAQKGPLTIMRALADKAAKEDKK